MVGAASIQTPFRANSPLQQQGCTSVYCLNEIVLSSFPNKGVFSLLFCPAGPIMTHNILHLSFVLFLSNQWRWFHKHPKKPFPSPCRPISPSSPFSVRSERGNQCSQNVDVNGPHHGLYQLMASSSLHCHRLVGWGRHNELEASMVGAVYVHFLRTLVGTSS